ncbi:MAG: hypothetical protein ACRDK7_04765 [Solirubrobacteraceae bacterium]
MATATQTATPDAPTQSPAESACDEALLQLLESLPARLEPETLTAILELRDVGKASETIARSLRLEPVVVELELRREHERRAPGAPATAQAPLPAQASLHARSAPVSLLSAREMNRLARGTHIPNCQLRTLVEGAIAVNPGLTLNAVLRAAGFTDNSHGRRVLGYAAHHGCPRPPATIRPGYAARIARAICRDPVEVEGL